MPLSKVQIDLLVRAGYNFPPAYCTAFNYAKGTGTPLGTALTVADMELKIHADLTSGERVRVKHGLANVIYWGLGGDLAGWRERWLKEFGACPDALIVNAAKLFRGAGVPSLKSIKKLGLPRFSSMSFVSKIRMFLDPKGSGVLDLKLLKLKEETAQTVLHQITTYGTKPTSIPISTKNSEKYEDWCKKLVHIQRAYFKSHPSLGRAADVERALFQLVDKGKAGEAAEILRDA